MSNKRDHGGGLDAAILVFGGARDGWLDLSTGINPAPYPVVQPTQKSWAALPDVKAQNDLCQMARRFWKVPEDAAILAAPGVSSLIARMPLLAAPGRVSIPTPTYNEHVAAFHALGWQMGIGEAQVLVHPNNPDGRLWNVDDISAPLAIIDESFCDTTPDASLMALASRPGTLILKSFGKFWGLAGLRLGFAIGDPELIEKLTEALGPWPVSGPALAIGTQALDDTNWANATRGELHESALRLDQLMTKKGARSVGGTSLFRLYEVENAAHWQERLARAHIWTRIFPYSDTWLRLGLPGSDGWDRLEAAL